MPRFTTRTLNEAAFRDAARELAQMACASFSPLLLIGIRTGGYVLAERMIEAWPAEAQSNDARPSQIMLLPITCRRPSTQKKEKSSLLKTLLKYLPLAINNRLRVMEHRLLTQRKQPVPISYIPVADELSAIAESMRRLGPSARALIIDDSVDSGATLEAVLSAVRTVSPPDATIKSAAITVTTTNPLAFPDFHLFRYVLCRFPWSLDFKR